MNKKNIVVLPLAASMMALFAATSGCIVPPPPPPGVAVEGVTPDYCFWDGDDYFGWYGGQYYCWDGGAWIVADHDRLDRIHRWEGDHPDWRSHATDSRMEPQMRTHLGPQEQAHPMAAPPARHYFHAAGGGHVGGGGGHEHR